MNSRIDSAVPVRTGRHHQDHQQLERVGVGALGGPTQAERVRHGPDQHAEQDRHQQVVCMKATVGRHHPAVPAGHRGHLAEAARCAWLAVPPAAARRAAAAAARAPRSGWRRTSRSPSTPGTRPDQSRLRARRRTPGRRPPSRPCRSTSARRRAGRSRPSCRPAASTMSRSHWSSSFDSTSCVITMTDWPLSPRPVGHLAHLRNISRLRCGSSGEVGSSRNSRRRLGQQLEADVDPLLLAAGQPLDRGCRRAGVIDSSSSTSPTRWFRSVLARCPTGSAARPRSRAPSSRSAGRA